MKAVSWFAKRMLPFAVVLGMIGLAAEGYANVVLWVCVAAVVVAIPLSVWRVRKEKRDE